MNWKIYELLSKRKDSIFTITLVLILFNFANSITQASDKTNSDSLSFFENLFHKPVVGSYEQTQFTNETTGLSEVSLGFGEENFKIHSAHLGEVVEINNLDLCKIGLGYKYYSDNRKANFDYIDFNLYNWKIVTTVFPDFYAGAAINLLNKKTTYFSNNYIDWGTGSLLLGVMIPYYGDYNIIDLNGQIGFGLSTFKPDTIICPNLRENLKKYNYQLGYISLNLSMNYKAVDLALSVEGKGSIPDSAFLSRIVSAKLSYSFWKGRTYTSADEDKPAFPTLFQIYLGFTFNNLSIGNPNNPVYSKELRMFDIGVSYNFGKL